MRVMVEQTRPSDRRFGLTLTAALGVLGLYGIVEHRSPVSIALLIAGLLFGIAALAAPRSLAPLNSAWTRFGELLGKVVGPLVLGVIFFGILTPIAVVTRLFGRDELRLRRPKVDSYWNQRSSDPASGNSFTRQF